MPGSSPWAAGAACLLVAAAATSTYADPSAARPLSARIHPIDSPATLERGEVATAVLSLENTGAEAWPAGGAIRLAYHWTRADGTPIVRDGRRTLLPAPVAAGATTRLCAQVEAPAEPGDLLLVWDLVKEGETWFSRVDPASALQQRVHVRPSSMAPPGSDARWRLAAWLVVSLVHLMASAWWASGTRADGARKENGSLDRLPFDTLLIALGSLHGVLFVAAATTGLGGSRGLWWVAVWNVAVALYLVRREAGHSGPATAGATPRPEAGPGDASPARDRTLAAMQACGAVAFGALAVSWLRVSARSLHVTGSDAAHYHVPHAVNYALGASPFDPLATPHAYPMGTSLLGAWFVLPVADPLLIDVVMLLAFALLATSLMRLFRLLMGQPGLAWIPWLMLALAAAPLVQTASLFSADLPFAATFAAACAQLLACRDTTRLSMRDVVLTALAFGLLCGVKTTGAAATVLLLGATALVWAVTRFTRRGAAAPAGRPAVARRRLLPILVAALAAWLAGGGLWLVRNEVRFGSPIAPSGLRVPGVTIFPGESFAQGSTYYSVAGDVAARASYSLVGRTGYFVRRWLGPVAWPTALLVAMLVLDIVSSRRRGPPGALETDRDLRGQALAVFAIVSIALVGLLTHAPWTSLEWTAGLSLRYALPIIIGTGFLAWLALFPRSWPWYERGPTRAAGWVLIAGVGTSIFVRSRAAIPHSSPDALPRLDAVSLGVAVAVLALGWLAARSRGWRLAIGTLGVVSCWPLAASLAGRDATLVVETQREEARVLRCVAAGLDEGLDRHTSLSAALLARERSRRQECPTRRVFLGARFDQPLALQPLPYRTLVFDTRGTSPGDAVVHDMGRSPCDYLVVARAELETDRGSSLLQRAQVTRAWTPVVERGGYVAFVAAP